MTTSPDSPPVVVVGPADGPQAGGEVATGSIEQPAKVMRIGMMVKQLLEEVRAAPLDEASRERLREIYDRSIAELVEGLSGELSAELQRLSLPFDGAGVPSDSELRVAQAQLVGWLEGLFHGIQTALFAQQVAARTQLEELIGRRAIGAAPGSLTAPNSAPDRSGPYL